LLNKPAFAVTVFSGAGAAGVACANAAPQRMVEIAPAAAVVRRRFGTGMMVSSLSSKRKDEQETIPTTPTAFHVPSQQNYLIQ
jgi:hypothetical protein